ATTMQDWAAHSAEFFHHDVDFPDVMPYLPNMNTVTDLQYFFAAVAPKPLFISETRERRNWPVEGFMRVKELATTVYGLTGNQDALEVVPVVSRNCPEEFLTWLKEVVK
ncbi:MAG: hypothetical protein WCO51_11090, partial [bacterium]